MKRLLRLTVVGLTLLWSSSVWALVEADYMISAVGGELSEQTVGVHLSPFPLPVSIGASYTQGAEESVETEMLLQEAFDIELRAWLPLPAISLVPYVRLGYTVAGSGKTIKGEGDQKVVVESDMIEGQRAALGVAVSPFRHVSFMLEAAVKSSTFNFEGITETASQLASSENMSQSEMRVGLSVGI